MESGEGLLKKLKEQVNLLLDKIKKIFISAKRKTLESNDKIKVPKILHQEIVKFLKNTVETIAILLTTAVTARLVKKLVHSIYNVKRAYKAYKKTKSPEFTEVSRSTIDNNLKQAQKILEQMKEKADALDKDPSMNPLEKMKLSDEIYKENEKAMKYINVNTEIENIPVLARKTLAKAISVMGIIVGLLGTWSVSLGVAGEVIKQKLK